MNDLYTILGVDRTATQEDIKRAYRKLAAQHHPDRGGDTKKFQEIQSAYDVLSDLQKKAEYDNPSPQMNNFHFHAHGFPPEFDNVFNQFGDMFGGMFRRHMPPRNKNLNIQTKITLEEAYKGKEIFAEIKLPSGRSETMNIKIPAGIHNGTTLRLHGLGDDSIPNVPRGDIHLTVAVEDHKDFQRNGDDLISIVNLNCLEAIVGTTATINTIDCRKLETQIPSGTQHGNIFSFQGYGMPNMSNSSIRGRLLIQINIVVPTNISQDKKDIIKQLLN